MSFEERLGLLVERESRVCESRQTTARLRRAKLKLPDAVPEDIEYRSARGLDRSLIGQLLLGGNWISERNSPVIIGATGLGKTWLACALANQACRQGFSALHLKMPRLSEDLAIAHASGRYAWLLAQWAKTDVLLMDDFAMAPMSDGAGRDLLEILDDRHGHRSTLVTSQVLSHGDGDSAKRLLHPGLGPIELEYSAFSVDGRPDLGMIVYTPLDAEVARQIRGLATHA